MRLPRMVFVGMFFVTLPAVAKDADKALYAAAPPENSAFVRIFNPLDKALSAQIETQHFDAVPPYSASAYKVLPEGNAAVKLDKQTISQSLQAGSYYTVVPKSNGEMTVMADAAISDITKALVVFYNLGSEMPLTLKAHDGEIDVVDAVAPGHSGVRAVNPLKVDFSVVNAAGKILKTLEPVILERGHVYNVFYTGGQAVVIKSQTDLSL